MSPEQQRIAIAEVCGWKITRKNSNTPVIIPVVLVIGPDGVPASSHWTAEDSGGWRGYLPDYLNDLNAMHEAEKTLSNKEFRDIDNFTETERSRYCSILEHVVTSAPKWSVFECYNATATQRAEAFLKTKGKWKE